MLQTEIPVEVYSELVHLARTTGRGEPEIVNAALSSYLGKRGICQLSNHSGKFSTTGTAATLTVHGPSREQRWLRAHESEYRGEWLALDGERLIAHGKDGRAVA